MKYEYRWGSANPPEINTNIFMSKGFSILQVNVDTFIPLDLFQFFGKTNYMRLC